MQSDVWWLLTCIDGDGILVQQVQWLNEIEIPGIQSRIRIESLSFEQWTTNKWKAKNKVEQKNEWRSNNEQYKWTTMINDEQQ